MPSPKFQPLHPRSSLRKFRCAFSSSASPSSEDPRSPISSPTFSMSPLSARTASSRLSSFSFGNMSSLSIGSAFQSRRTLIRRKKSMLEIEQEDERNIVGEHVLSLVEPRPQVGTAYGGIEEVLEGVA